VWYELKYDKEGNRYLVATMPMKIREIIELYKKHIGKEAKIYAVPGTAGLCMEKWQEDAVDHTMYRKIIGNIMFCVVKIFPEGANAARELARHFLCSRATTMGRAHKICWIFKRHILKANRTEGAVMRG
jgi:hypothetical protein